MKFTGWVENGQARHPEPAAAVLAQRNAPQHGPGSHPLTPAPMLMSAAASHSSMITAAASSPLVGVAVAVQQPLVCLITTQPQRRHIRKAAAPRSPLVGVAVAVQQLSPAQLQRQQAHPPLVGVSIPLACPLQQNHSPLLTAGRGSGSGAAAANHRRRSP